MKTLIQAAGLAAILAATPLAAEVTEVDEAGFVTRDEALVEADTKQTWLALISPSRYWNSSHSWSGDAANMRLTPQAGGCFCEKIPEDLTVDRVTLEGSVEHMRVIHAFPERALRMSGALGPLQSEPVTGILTVALSPTETGGTRIVWEYHVGGRTRFPKEVISRAVDGVMSQQLNGLAQLLGPVAPIEEEPAADAEPNTDEQADAGAESSDAVEEMSAPSVDEAEAEGPAVPSVADAFADLSEEQ